MSIFIMNNESSIASWTNEQARFILFLIDRGKKDYVSTFLFPFTLYTIVSTTQIEDYYSQNKTKCGFQPYFLLS